MVPHALNWVAGWWLVLGAFVTGAMLGLGFHREGFLGGYDSLRRRLARLGHIALAALGMLNILYGLSPFPAADTTADSVAGLCLLLGSIAMPLVCFLSAWRERFRLLFFIPLLLLCTGVAVTAIVGGGTLR